MYFFFQTLSVPYMKSSRTIKTSRSKQGVRKVYLIAMKNKFFFFLFFKNHFNNNYILNIEMIIRVRRWRKMKNQREILELEVYV